MSAFQPRYSSFQPHHAQFADQALELRVRSFLITHAQADPEELSISATAGRVTLRGSARSPKQKQLIEICCRHVAGVRHVISELRLQATSRASVLASVAPTRRFRHDFKHSSAYPRRQASWSFAKP